MLETKKVVVFCDGGSRGNPGPSASGVVIKSTNGKILGEYCEFLGEKTNNFAEYSAVILALQKLREMQVESATFYLDSLLVVQQLKGIYKIKHPDMIELYKKVQSLASGMQLEFNHVLRAKNKEADAMVNQCLDSQL